MKSMAAAIAATLFGVAAQAEEPIKIGFITTLTTPAAAIGNDMVDAVKLSVDHVGGTIAGHPIEILFEDDGLKPELGRQKAEKLVRQDEVDIVAGFIWSNVLLAARKTVLDSGKFLISTNAGPSDLAGRLCNPNFFSLRGQNDMLPIALGKVMNERGVKRLYIMAPNYAAGNDMAAGVERTFAGEVVGRDFTKWGEDPQLDFSAEFAKVAASGADALFAFYPGRASAFARQFEQSGLAGKVKLYSVYTMDQIALPQRRMKVVIMVSRFGHCVNDLLHRWRIGALPIDMVAVISSHLGYQNIESSLGLRGIPIASCPSSGNLVNLVG